MLARRITAVAGWAAHEFYVLDQRGAAVPAGPVLVVANHPNALLDPLIIFRVAGRVVRPLAKEPLFKHLLIGPVLKALGGLPVYRRQDHPGEMHQNEQTFAAAVAALHAGDAVQIYPEGQSHSEARLTPFKTGAARIAFKAEAEADWKLRLLIVPVGLTYTRKTFFRGRAVAVVGEAFAITPYRELYERDPVAAVKQLTDEFTQQVEALTLNLTRTEDVALIDVAEKLYAREKGLAGWREEELLGARLPRMQAFARGLAWLREHDPARHARLAREVRHYARLRRTIGAGEGDVPPDYSAAIVLRYVAREAFMLGIGLPLALLALVFWYPPYLLNQWIVGRLQVEESGIATYKLGLSMVLFPLTFIIWCVLAYRWWAGAGLAAALVTLPALAWVLNRWAGRWHRVRQDVQLFLNVTARPRAQHDLAQQRRRLVQEFDDVARYV
jgi:1-acyl-sn-glycerol-3-phosphate acyltransferase